MLAKSGQTHSLIFSLLENRKGEVVMSKKKITDLVPELLETFLKTNGYELFNVEYLKEGKDWYLRIYIDKLAVDDAEPDGISTDDCEKVSRFISEKLDEADPIERNYYLEVSSPGLDRPLNKESDYIKYKGYLVDVLLYKAMNGTKTITGELEGLSDDQIILKDINGKIIEISKDKVAKTKLAVIF
jgi:ribosome maturation factor RimP